MKEWEFPNISNCFPYTLYPIKNLAFEKLIYRCYILLDITQILLDITCITVILSRLYQNTINTELMGTQGKQLHYFNSETVTLILCYNCIIKNSCRFYTTMEQYS